MTAHTMVSEGSELQSHIESLGSEAVELTVAARHEEAAGIISLTLRHANGRDLPAWRPGGHIDITTPAGLRQYSLCGDPNRADEWMIAVLDEPDGRGGSKWIHEHVFETSNLWASSPRDTFRFSPVDSALLIAGGIGITPILPIAEELTTSGAQLRMLYTAREAGSHAFAERCRALGGSELWASGSRGRIPLRQELEAAAPGVAIYCCGPDSLVDEVTELANELGIADQLRVERFSADVEPVRAGDSAFSVTMSRSGKDIVVPAGTTLLERLGEEGAFVVSSCHAGICGSCETPLLSGRAEHRDQVLTDEEKAVGDCIFPCVSRALPGEHLVLDI